MKKLSKVAALVFLMVFPPLQAWAVTQTADEVVSTTTDQVLKAVSQEGVKDDNQKIYDIVERLILPHFDFQKMSQWVLGKYWRQANDSERQQFSAQFQKLLVRTYSTAFQQYTNQKVVCLPTHSDPGADRVLVKCKVVREGGPPINIDYRLHRNNGEWKVFDVMIDGISLVTNYRTTFSQQIRDKGIDGLIATLTERNQESAKR
jgi:phospholipid transport system substrate-binding protein